jgi:hypothetical protein
MDLEAAAISRHFRTCVGRSQLMEAYRWSVKMFLKTEFVHESYSYLSSKIVIVISRH